MYSETANKFESDIRERIEYFRTEFDLSYGEAIGILEILKFELLCETIEDDDDEEDESESRKNGQGGLDKPG